MAQLPPVPYRTPMYDQGGNLSSAWAAWFRQLFARVGGSGGTSAEAVAADLSNHLNDTTAHLASTIPVSPTGNLLSTNAQAAFEEHQADIDKLNADILTVNGDSAYEVAVANGFVGTETEWLASLVGDTGATGPQGSPGPQGSAGVQGPEGPPGGAVNTKFAVNPTTGFIYTSSVSGHAYILEFAA